MMKNRLLTYCILLVLSFFDINVLANTEASDAGSYSPGIETANSDNMSARMQLKGTDVKVNINGSIAEVTVRQQYKNNGDQIFSGSYTIHVPERGLVHGMKMKTDGITYKAKVKEQKSAQQEFDRFGEEGKNVLLLKENKPNLLSINLANIMPGETFYTELRYIELLIPTDMKYRFVYPAISDSVESDRSETVFNIEVNISAGIPIQELMCSSHDTDIIIDTESSARVLLKNQDGKASTRDYILTYRLAEQKLPSGLILSGGGDEKFLLLNEYVGSPGLKNISVKFTDLKAYDLEPSNIPDTSSRRPVTLLGKWEGEADGLIKVEGTMNRRNYSKAYRFVKNNTRKTDGALKHLWAGKRIERLSGLNTGNEDADINSEITDLGLKYDVLTKNTSFIALNDTARNTVITEEKIRQSVPLPAEDPKPAPTAFAKVPEPGLYLLVFILTSVFVTGKVRKKAVEIFSGIGCK